MPAVTRSRKQAKKSPDFHVLIDKTPRNIISQYAKATGKGNPKPKKKNVLQVVRAPSAAEPKSRAKAKLPAKGPSMKAEGEARNTAQSPHVGEPDDPLQCVISAAGSSGVFATPPRSSLATRDSLIINTIRARLLCSHYRHQFNFLRV